jgi:hypothetical protein
MDRSRAGTWLRRILLGAGGIFVVLQVVPVERTNPPVVSALQARDDVQQILRAACYDCHSNETRWPWYSHVAPVSWWVVDHVEHARGHLNFSDWPALDARAREHALEEIQEMVESGEMPLRSYALMHSGARLDAAERERLLSWAADER